MKAIEKDITVNIYRGVHGRVATRLAQIAQRYKVQLYILKNGDEIDCSSVLDVLSLAFVSGTLVKFKVHGAGSDQAISAVEQLLTERGEP